MANDAVVTYVTILSRHLSGGTGENMKILRQFRHS